MTVKKLVQGALIGALYAVLTLAAAPISYGLMQVRVSEALSVLPYFTAAAVPGLFVGCIVANLLGGAALYDVIFGSLATLLAALLTRWFKKRGFSKWLAPLPAVLMNAVIVGALMCLVYMPGEVTFLAGAAYVGAGQAIACYGLGMPLMYVLERYGNKLFRSEA
ncbi:MAG: QueT transporter family protein [bacterium]|nr:QueT transporter family protein [bacterium]